MTPSLWYFGLMPKLNSNKFTSLEFCPHTGQILSGAKCYSSTNLLSGRICVDHPGTKYALPKSLCFCCFQIFFFSMSFYPSSEIWSTIHFGCVIRQAGFCSGDAWLHCRKEIRSPHWASARCSCISRLDEQLLFSCSLLSLWTLL